MSKNYVLANLSQAVTLEPLVRDGRFTKIKNDDLGIVKNAWIAVSNGKISCVSSGTIPKEYLSYEQIDCKQGVALPGLVDAHTHPVFAGSRANEFCMRLDGKTYQEIAALGGGIAATVVPTRQTSTEDLEVLVQQRLKTFFDHGVTTVEVKSGYGLTIDEELRHLRVLTKIKNSSPQSLVVTCLALHAVPKEANSSLEWSKACAKDLLPVVKKENLASGVDAFIEAGYFSVQDVKPFFDSAKSLGLDIRLHADEFSDADAASCAADYSALSADHLQYASDLGIKKMAEKNVVALLLPGTSLYSSIPYTNARKFIEAGCAVGLATDFNPGSCPVDNLRMTLTLGALHCKLSMAEAIAAVTWVPAKSLKLHKSKGALVTGMDSDILVMPFATAQEFVADMGRTKPLVVTTCRTI